jgi:hypothetical protein
VPLVLLLLLVLVPLVVIALTPLLLIQRYRAGTARRQARPWVATLNLGVMAFSAVFFLISSAFTTIWIPQSFTGAAAGMMAGVLLGGIGLLLTRWEASPRSLHYTPNSVLVLIVTVIVSARVAYGLFRSLTLAGPGASGTELIAAFGVPQSLAAGGAVIGYYLAYNIGLRWRIRRWERRALRPM